MSGFNTPSSGGGFTTQSDVTVSRFLDTVYQNNSGKTMMVNISVELTANGGFVLSTAMTDTNNPPTTNVASATALEVTGLVHTNSMTLSFIVLMGNYYEISTFPFGLSTITKLSWIEWTWLWVVINMEFEEEKKDNTFDTVIILVGIAFLFWIFKSNQKTQSIQPSQSQSMQPQMMQPQSMTHANASIEWQPILNNGYKNSELWEVERGPDGFITRVKADRDARSGKISTSEE